MKGLTGKCIFSRQQRGSGKVGAGFYTGDFINLWQNSVAGGEAWVDYPTFQDWECSVLLSVWLKCWLWHWKSIDRDGIQWIDAAVTAGKQTGKGKDPSLGGQLSNELHNRRVWPVSGTLAFK